MKYLVKYKLFESNSKKDMDSIKSKIFRFYTPIPLNRFKSSFVLQILMKHYKIEPFDIIKTGIIDLRNIGGDEHNKLKNALRFEEYLNDLLGMKNIETGVEIDKASRGFNFEGLISGLFGGDISRKSDSIYDIKNVNTNGSQSNCSVKFIEDKTESIRITNIENSLKLIEDKSTEYYRILTENNLFDILYSNNTNYYKEKGDNEENYNKIELERNYKIEFEDLLQYINDFLTNIVFKEVDYFIIGNSYNDEEIEISVISKINLIDFIIENGLQSPKNKGKNEIRLHSSICDDINYITNKIKIKIPKLSYEEVLKVYNGENRNWASIIFGDWSDKMRTDLIDHIYNNRQNICRSIKSYDELKSKYDSKN